MTATLSEGDTKVSVADDSLDALIERASVPSLATLFGQAKQQGLIQPVLPYGGENASAPSAPPFT